MITAYEAQANNVITIRRKRERLLQNYHSHEE